MFFVQLLFFVELLLYIRGVSPFVLLITPQNYRLFLNLRKILGFFFLFFIF